MKILVENNIRINFLLKQDEIVRKDPSRQLIFVSSIHLMYFTAFHFSLRDVIVDSQLCSPILTQFVNVFIP